MKPAHDGDGPSAHRNRPQQRHRYAYDTQPGTTPQTPTLVVTMRYAYDGNANLVKATDAWSPRYTHDRWSLTQHRFRYRH